MRSILLPALRSIILFLLPVALFGQAPPLGTASSFALFTSVGAFTNVGATQITGDIGVNVGALTGVPLPTVMGQTHVADPASAQAAIDVQTAYGALSAVPCGVVLGVLLGNNQTLTPGVYCQGAASTLTGDLILDGQNNPNALFIFKIGGAFATGVGSRIILTNGASLCNVYWQITGAVALGQNSTFRGTIVALGAINLLDGATLFGRGLTTAGAINLIRNTVTVAMRPVASIITASGPTTFCAGGSVTLSGNNGGTWSTGATTPSITVTTSGDYFVTNTANCGSVNSNHIIVTVNPLPNCTITGGVAICQGQTTQLCATPGLAAYLWSTGATTNCITVSAAGTYSVTVTDANGCSSACSQTVTVNPTPNCSITGNASVCSGQSSQLCVPAGSASYLWSTGATTNCITVSTAGTYSVTVTNANGCISVCSQAVTVGNLTTCTITGNGNLCPGQSTQLCVPAGAISYLWSTGATTNCITVSAAGTYSVTVTNAGGCTSVCSQMVTVTPLPNCTITGNTSLCSGQSTQLCVPAGSASYLWSTGATTNCITVSAAATYSVTVTNANGCTSVCSQAVTVGTVTTCMITGNSNISQGQTTQLCVPAGAVSYLWSTGATTNCITVSAAGTYSVTVTNGGGCTSVCSQMVTINPLPSCLITGNFNICAGQSTQLCAPTGAASYLWSTGATTNCITVSMSGTYSVTVTNANGVASVCSQAVTVGSLIVCTITGNGNLCPGQSTQLCVPAGAISYLWSTGATTNCITVSAAGTYSVTVTNAGGCTSVCSQIVTVTPLPNCTINGNASLCFGQSSQLCVPAGAASYLWSTGATTNCITISTPGTYSVTVTNANGCTSVCSQVVTVGSLTTCTITGNGNLCSGQSTQLCVPAGAISYLWSTGATTNCITVSAAGMYSVTITNGPGCTSVCSQMVTITPLPNCTITGNTSLCSGQSTQLCVPAGSASYLWSTGATTNCITANAAGMYSVTVSNGNGCNSTCSQIVTVGSQTSCLITGASIICPGQTTQLCVPAGAASYLWSTGATTNCITVGTPGTYSVTVNSGNGCSSTCSQVVSSLTTCTLTGNPIICPGQSAQLCAPIGFATYLWTTGATTNCITVNTAGTYCVTVTTGNGCVLISSRTVTVASLLSTAITISNPTCQGANGSVSVQVFGGVAPYTYIWSTGSTASSISLLSAGKYSVTVTDSLGCTATQSVLLTQPSTIAIAFITSASSPCTATGSFATATASGGTAPYKYLWSNGVIGASIINVSAGTYTITVTDANNCSAIGSVTLVLPPATLTCTINSTLGCVGTSDGLFQALATGGTSPFSYKWSNGATTQMLSGVPSGTYTVTITDANGCTTSCSAALTAPTVCDNITNPGIISGSQTFCPQTEVVTGISSVQGATGGSGMIEYMWMRSTFNAVFNQNDYTAVPNSNSPFLTAAQVGDITEVTYFARCVRRACCAKFIETNVIVKRPQVLLPASFPYDLCAGRAYIFEAPENGPNAIFSWNFGTGATPSTSTARQVSVVYSAVGNYPLTLRTFNNGCYGTNTVNISVNNLGCQPGYGSFAFVGFNANMTTSKKVMLDWTTANENSRLTTFFVQRSADGKDFKDIQETPSNGGQVNTYHYMDETPKHGRAFYRIRNVDYQGSAMYSDVKQTILTNQPGQSVLIYPNPATTILYVEVLDQENTEGVMEIINAAGQTVITKSFNKDQSRYDVSLESVADGIYLVKVRLTDGTLHTVKVMKMN